MVGSLLAILKGFAVALGWAKQASDEHTGAELEKGKANAELLESLQRGIDAGSNAGQSRRVREQSFRD